MVRVRRPSRNLLEDSIRRNRRNVGNIYIEYFSQYLRNCRHYDRKRNRGFFLAILPLNGTLLGSYRTSLTSWETKVIELSLTSWETKVIERGQDFKPLATKNGALEKIRIPETEDGRVF